MQNNDKEQSLFTANTDIITLLKLADDIGWESMNELNVYRLLYLSSVLYSFRFPGERNPFENNYHFVISYKGPYEENIQGSLLFLQTRDYITINEEKEVFLNNDQLENDFNSDEAKTLWLERIVQLMAIQGIDKVYEFVIRDPEYHKNAQINPIKEIDLSTNSETVKFLNEFKNDFEKALGKDALQIDHGEYLQLYFEYVFSKIVKGDIDL